MKTIVVCIYWVTTLFQCYSQKDTKPKTPKNNFAQKQLKNKTGPAGFTLPNWITLNNKDDSNLIYHLRIDTGFFGSKRVLNTGSNAPFLLYFKDSDSTTRHRFAGKLIYTNAMVYCIIDSALLNYKIWNIDKSAKITFSKDGLLVNNLLLTQDSAKLLLSSVEQIPGSALEMIVKNTKVADIFSLIKNDSTELSGLVDAKLLLNNISNNVSSVTGEAFVKSLALHQQLIGNISMVAQKLAGSDVKITLQLDSNGNKASFTGTYNFSNPQQQLNALLKIESIDFSLLKNVFKNAFTSAKGSLNGAVQVNGTFKKPQWKGIVNIDTVSFFTSQSETAFGIYNQKILLNYPSVQFERFTITDSLKNTLSIDGKLLQQQKEWGIDLRMQTNNFGIINSSTAINNQFYGYATITATISMMGTSKLPLWKGDVTLNEATRLTFLMPEKNTDQATATAVVKFINADTFQFNTVNKRNVFIPKVSTGTPINNNLILKIHPHASFHVVMDPSLNDELKLKGNSKIKAGILPDGHLIFTGPFEIDSGYYELNYQFLKKRFYISQGGSILFTGNPDSTQVNINAVYVANTSLGNLLGSEVGVVSPLVSKDFNKKIPFDVLLNLSGLLNQPAISFDIRLPAQAVTGMALRGAINNKLSQLRSDLPAINKQVFALLVMERFVGEQSRDFFKGNSSATAVEERSSASVSRFLAAALDEIASDLFKGINTDLNLNSYKDFSVNEGLQKTDLGVTVSKTFLNDRLSITVGRTYGIDGEDGSAKAAKQKGLRFMPDVTLNYKLTADGKYLLRSYNKDQFEVLLDGYVVETGLAFIIRMDYEKYRELLSK